MADGKLTVEIGPIEWNEYQPGFIRGLATIDGVKHFLDIETWGIDGILLRIMITTTDWPKGLTFNPKDRFRVSLAKAKTILVERLRLELEATAQHAEVDRLMEEQWQALCKGEDERL